MVDDTQPTFWNLAFQRGWTIDGARETRIGLIERRFPHVSELVQDKVDFGLIGVIVHEYDDSFPRRNHRSKRRPTVQVGRR